MSLASHRVLLVALAASSFLAAAASHAQVTVPPGQEPGHRYRLAFVTSETRDATSADFRDYDAFVTNAAQVHLSLSRLRTTWSAIVSTPASNAFDTTNTNPGVAEPLTVYNLAGERVSGSTLGGPFWGALRLANQIDHVESGGPVPPPLSDVWTGTTTAGTGIAGGTLGEACPRVGSTRLDGNGSWVDYT